MFKTAAVLVVSDFFLRGVEEESVFKNVLTFLNYLNYVVKKVSVLHENEQLITNELSMLSKQFDVVIVTGKVSDIILKSLAKLTSQNLTPNLKFKAILEALLEKDGYYLPPAAKLHTGKDLIYPVIQIQSIFILNDKYLEKHLNILRDRLKQYNLQAAFSKVVRIQMNGNTIEILDKMKNHLIKTITYENETILSVVLETTCFGDIVEIERVIQQEFKNHFIESYIRNIVIEDIYTDPDEQIQQALESIEKCLKDYGPENIFLSFNGGKDCTVLLHLIHTVMTIKYPHKKTPIICLYIKSENAFSEQDNFISQCKIYYNLEMITVVKSIKEGLNDILTLKPHLKACLMGTRKTDPFSRDLKIFQMTDPNWPQVMRVSPLLNWHYSDIWDYILYYKVPYCKLYDMGYTSLGNASNTIRNPSLLYYDIYLGCEVYLPAYKMLNENKERSGRDI